jgi:hypothetical protein
MKNLLLLLLAFPALICAELAFPYPYEKLVQRDYFSAFYCYTYILQGNEYMSDLERLEATLGRGMSAMCICEQDFQEFERLLQKCVNSENKEKSLEVKSKFYGMMRG